MKQDRFSVLNKVDFLLFVPMILLCALSVLFIYSSGISIGTGTVSNSSEYIRQILWTVLGVVFFVLLSFVRYYIFKELSLYFYIGFILLVVGTLFIGRVVNGAKAWIGVGELGIQPSEFLKIATILYLAKHLERYGIGIQNLRNVILSSLFVILPIVCILLQPDLGTALVFIPIYIAMLFISGAQPRHIVFIALLIILTVLFVLVPAWAIYIAKIKFELFTNRLLILAVAGFLLAVSLVAFLGYRLFKRRYFYWIMYFASILTLAYGAGMVLQLVLKPYQIMRLIVFLDPDLYAKSFGWNIIQSVSAVGSGGFGGKGFLQGTQSHYRFLPEQSTDFIFSIFSEETGFLGVAALFAIYTIIVVRIVYIIRNCKDTFSAAVATGILSMIAFHVIINIGMTIGSMPITGIPLIFLSYGGSSLLSAMMAMGILSSINSQRYNL